MGDTCSNKLKICCQKKRGTLQLRVRSIPAAPVRVLTSWCTLCTPGPSVPHTSCLSRALPAPNLTCGSLYSLHRELEYRYQQMSLVIVNFTPYHLQWSPIHLSIHSVLSVKMVISYQHLKRSCSNISENSLKGRSLFEVKSYNISPVYYCKPPHSITLTIFHCFMILCLTFIIQNLKMVSINAQFKNCFVYHVPLAYPLIDFSAYVNNFTFQKDFWTF
jgi:hypothetical protein